ncbi:MAG: ABC transporter ATP-binding protein [Methanophagales archaeon]|nr:ABC transporter ATP-binding protein [Methanophagales archaeon]RLG35405.1 MAG: ABC transporter ATP-binding protein [Methanosarcinales archaeon]MCW3137634.1 ABC transporter ATP-binding protein [Methanophagales archaeon]MCW3140358.1 ABC transporter ATP-binding protein [Methanophagales archaeon]MCW7069512.1 ABC transporter ATP-binding protein [Methanophagales archaeon]
MLEIKELNVSYEKVQVLWGVSFTVNEGEIVSLLGSNGAGKSTTVKTIQGLLKSKSGSIRFMDRNIEGLPAYKIVDAGISLVPEGREIFPKMSVLENLILGAYVPRARDLLEESLEWVFQLFPKLEERKKQLAGTMSGGEQQMLAIARALMSKPKLLMLDEPSLGLAPVLVLQVFEVIKKLNEEGVTILLVEQNVHHALELSDRGYVLEKGRIILEGKGSELLEHEYVKNAYLGI